jgi:hypothetical protein
MFANTDSKDSGDHSTTHNDYMIYSVLSLLVYKYDIRHNIFAK